MRWSSCPVRWPTKAATTSGSRLRWLNCGPVRWPAWLAMSCYRSAVAADTRPPNPSPRAVSGRYQWSRWCGTCGSTGSSKGPVRSCGCSSRVKRSTRTSLPRVIWRTLRPICGRRPRRRPAPAGSTRSGCRSWFSAKANYPRRTASSAPWRHICVLSNARHANWPATPSTGWRAGRPAWRKSKGSSAASWISAPSYSPSPRRVCAPRRSERPIRSRVSRHTNWPRRSASRPRCGWRRCSTRCGPTTDSIDVRLANDVLEGRYTWLEQGILDQSEGTGPWIASWEPGPSTEANLARRFLTVSPSSEAKL